MSDAEFRAWWLAGGSFRITPEGRLIRHHLGDALMGDIERDGDEAALIEALAVRSPKIVDASMMNVASGSQEAMCRCGYRRRFHEGKKLMCVVAGSRCDGFVEVVEEAVS